MSASIEELRKLLIRPQPATIHVGEGQAASSSALGTARDNVNAEKEKASAVASSLTSEVLNYIAASGPDGSGGEKSGYQLAQVVGRIFEPAHAFRESIGALAKTFEQLDLIAQSASRALAPMRAFKEQIERVAESFGPMITFQNQLAQLARDFEPMKGLHEQLSQLGQAFHDHLVELSRALEPARKLHNKVVDLAEGLGLASEIQREFNQLAGAFKIPTEPASSHPDRSNDSHASGNGA